MLSPGSLMSNVCCRSHSVERGRLGELGEESDAVRVTTKILARNASFEEFATEVCCTDKGDSISLKPKAL